LKSNFCQIKKNIGDLVETKERTLNTEFNIEGVDQEFLDDDEKSQEILKLRENFRMYSNSVLIFLQKVYLTLNEQCLLKRQDQTQSSSNSTFPMLS